MTGVWRPRLSSAHTVANAAAIIPALTNPGSDGIAKYVAIPAPKRTGNHNTHRSDWALSARRQAAGGGRASLDISVRPPPSGSASPPDGCGTHRRRCHHARRGAPSAAWVGGRAPRTVPALARRPRLEAFCSPTLDISPAARRCVRAAQPPPFATVAKNHQVTKHLTLSANLRPPNATKDVPP